MIIRPRRLRVNPAIRSLVRETSLSVDDFIIPLFMEEGTGIRSEIPSMPGYFRFSPDLAVEEVRDLAGKGFKAVLLFVKIAKALKDNRGAEAVNPDGLMQRSIQEIKSAVPEMVVMTDLALDPFSVHGHDGIVEGGRIANDPTIEVLAEMSLSHARAGTDFVAPSDMMDGRVAAIRTALEENGHHDTGIMAYSAKYASCFYGPFRDALDSAPGFGDKRTYQMDPANAREALMEAALDIEEGADIVMVKPAMPYLDIIRRVSEISERPVAAYQVSGEYAMIKAAAMHGWVDEQAAIAESLLSIKRAGAQLIASYFAKHAFEIFKW